MTYRTGFFFSICPAPENAIWAFPINCGLMAPDPGALQIGVHRGPVGRLAQPPGPVGRVPHAPGYLAPSALLFPLHFLFQDFDHPSYVRHALSWFEQGKTFRIRASFNDINRDPANAPMTHLSERWHEEVDFIFPNQGRPVVVHNISLLCFTDLELSSQGES